MLLLLIVRIIPVPIILGNELRRDYFARVESLHHAFNVRCNLQRTINKLFLITAPVLALHAAYKVEHRIALIEIIVLNELIKILKAIRGHVLLSQRHMRLHLPFTAFTIAT